MFRFDRQFARETVVLIVDVEGVVSSSVGSLVVQGRRAEIRGLFNLHIVSE